MNQKYIIKTAAGTTLFLVLDPAADKEEQLCRAFHMTSKSESLFLEGNEIVFRDLPHWEVMARHKILSVEDTDLPVTLTPIPL